MPRQRMHTYLVASVMTHCFLLCAHASDAIITLQAQSQTQLDALFPDGIDSTQRRQLMSLDATASRVIDVDANPDYLVTQVQSVPTLSLLKAAVFDSSTETWSFEYETMQVDATVPGQLNYYDRIMYLTRSDSAVGVTDNTNGCLARGVTYAQCLAVLSTAYTVLGAPQPGEPVEGGDRLETDGLTICDTCGITSNLNTEPGTLLQNLTMTVPHATLRDFIATTSISTSQEFGNQTALKFGVGIVFIPRENANADSGSATNLLIFDHFMIVENTFSQLAVSKTNSYSVATHVAFSTMTAEGSSTARIATIEYLLDKGHILKDIAASLNGPTGMSKITSNDCMHMEQILQALPDSTCLTGGRALCTPSIYTEGQGADAQSWVTYSIPIPPWHVADTYEINTLVITNNTVMYDGAGIEVLSPLNFATSHAPRIACKSTSTLSFDVNKHVKVELYRGHGLQVDTVHQGTFTVHNSTSLSMVEALMTVVLRPDDTPEALAYFQEYTDEEVRLDELYMSHALFSNDIPSEIYNRVEGVGNGRSQLVLDSHLTANCPVRRTLNDDYNMCVTTQDWSITGKDLRPQDTLYYVHELTTEAEDLAWLSNVFGSSDPDLVSRFRNEVIQKVNDAAPDREPFRKIYWVWPVFQWQNRAVIGLEDTTVVSLAWSVAPSVATGSSSARRLLATTQDESRTDPANTKQKTSFSGKHAVKRLQQLLSDRRPRPHRYTTRRPHLHVHEDKRLPVFKTQ